MRRAPALWLAVCGGLSLTSGLAQQADGPDMDFLEYLGTWQENDEEWLIVSEWEQDEAPPADGRPDTDTEDADE